MARLMKDDNVFFEENLAENDIFGAKGQVSTAVNRANFRASQDLDMVGYGEHGNPRYDNVCWDCVRDIMDDSGLPVPETSSVDVMMDAMEGLPVKTWDTPEYPEVWPGHAYYKTIVDPNELQAGDILVVQSRSGRHSGKHAVFVTGVSGGANNTGFFSSLFTGVDIVHDKGKGHPIKKEDYEWSELVYGQAGENAGNRKFIVAYRYNQDHNVKKPTDEQREQYYEEQ
jgi:hypothetical protein